MGYDASDNFSEAKHLPPHGAFITQHGYGYDAVDRRVSATGSAGDFGYGYDDRDWLLSRTPAGGGAADESYAYDDVGNRTGGHLAGGQDYGAERLNRLLLDDAFTYTYDGDGNLLSKVGRGDGATTTYTWDTQGRLSSVILPGGAVVRYRYDVLGRRVQRVAGAAAESYAYDGHDLVGVYEGAGPNNTLKESYIYGPGIDNVLAAIRHTQSGTEVVYYHKDGLNSVTAVTDAEHNVLRRYVYDSFGNLATQPQDRFTYTGRELDSDTGLYFYRARYYDAKAGRFISEDPVWDVNLYPYVGNDPVRFVDPFGEEGAAGAFFGGMFQSVGDEMNGISPTWEQKQEQALQKIDMYYGHVPMSIQVGQQKGSFNAGLVEWNDKMNPVVLGYTAATGMDSYGNQLSTTERVLRGGGAAASLFAIGGVANSCSVRGMFGSRLFGRTPGRLMQVREAMSPVAAAYQSKITGVAGDMSYVVNGVRFDGYKAGRLLEAKGPGYAKFIKNGEYAGWFRGKNALLNQANRQTKAAGKTPIEWHFAEEAAANATRNLFVTQKIKGIKVIYNP